MAQNTTHYGLFGLAAIAGLLLALSTGSAVEESTHDVDEPAIADHSLQSAATIRKYVDLRDTLFTTDSVWLEVDLSDQDVTLHFRDGSTRSFLISSGNPYIRDGIATPTGIFTVQNKVPMAISRQFDDARLHNWIGVYGGVGFHGLDGNGYYWNLGKRASSHGCIRMAREEIRDMYDLVHVGAPILVRDAEPARVIAFCDPADTIDSYRIDSSTAYVRSIGSDRISSLYDGAFYEESTQRLVHIAGTKVGWRIESGLKSRVPRQNIPLTQSLPPVAELVTALAD